MSSRIVVIFGIISLAAVFIYKKCMYSAGVDFNLGLKSAPSVMIVIFVVAFVIALLASFRAFSRIVRKELGKKWLLVLPLPVISCLAWLLPMSGFVDGMEERVESELNSQLLLDFAEKARSLTREEEDYFRSDEEKVEALVRSFPKIALGESSPRVRIEKDHVVVFYREPLVGEWGIWIDDTGNNSVAESLEEKVKMNEVFKQVWVCENIY